MALPACFDKPDPDWARRAHLPLDQRVATADPSGGCPGVHALLGMPRRRRDSGDRDGPNLCGVVGQPVASRSPRFAYTAALKRLGGIWTIEGLDRRAHDTGERLLFVDDINDGGRTIGLLRARLAAEGAVSGSVRFATLIDNVVSDERVEYSARVIDRTATKVWFVFPREAVAPAAAIEADAAEVPKRTA